MIAKHLASEPRALCQGTLTIHYAPSSVSSAAWIAIGAYPHANTVLLRTLDHRVWSSNV